MNNCNASYFNRRNWILENYESLNLSTNEGIILLMIDFLNEQHQDLSLSVLALKTHLNEKEVDDCLSLLATKGYLKIENKNKNIFFNIDNVFSEKKDEVDLKNIFEMFEEEFGRILNQNELRELNEWLAKYPEKDIIKALRQASIYNKKSFTYIRGILNNMSR